jgi:Xaa-Pro dipeptidase
MMQPLLNAEARLRRLREIMGAHGLDVVALIPGSTLRYLTGGVHYVMERPILWLVPLRGQPVAVIPKLEIPLFAQHLLPAQVFSWTDKEGYEAAFRAAFDLLNLAGKRVGVEGRRLRFFEGEILRRLAPNATIAEADEVLAELRIRKDEHEIMLIRRAIAISESALERTLATVEAGMTERTVAAQLEAHLKELGADGLAFSTILHGGANTALPHMGPLDEPIQMGDAILVDFGATVEGYCADITRTVFLGEPTDAMLKFYDVVQRANAAGRAAVKPGVSAGAVDRAAQAVLIEAGYEALIRHRTGHGLGLEAHEAPYIVDGNEQALEPGMVITIEPGIYEMGVLGVRIEDDVLITAEGAETLTTFPRDPQVLRR